MKNIRIPNTVKSIYLSGWISSNATEDQMNKNKQLFNEVERFFIARGMEVNNPAKLNISNGSYEAYMYESFLLQKKSKVTYLLPNYDHSFGSRMEVLNAERLGHKVFYNSHDLDVIANIITERFNISLSDMRSTSKDKNVVQARFMFYYLAHNITSNTKAESAMYLDKNVNSIAYAFKEITRGADRNLNYNLSILKDLI